MAFSPSRDYGEFTNKTSLNDDLKLVREAIERAKHNPVKPGEHGLRIVVSGKTPTGHLTAIKTYHVDTNKGIVTITETINGKETAQRTYQLGDLG